MIEFITAITGLAWRLWSDIQAGKSAEAVKRRMRDEADVTVDNAIAKRRLKARVGK